MTLTSMRFAAEHAYLKKDYSALDQNVDFTLYGPGAFHLTLTGFNDTISSTVNYAVVLAGGGDDLLRSDSSFFFVEGNDGNDTLIANSIGGDGGTLDGGAGNDVIQTFTSMAWLSPNDSTIRSTLWVNGGKGDDLYYVRSDYDWVEVAETDGYELFYHADYVPDGRDRIVLTFFNTDSFTMGQGIEELEIAAVYAKAGGGSYMGTIFGNNLNNLIINNDADGSDNKVPFISGGDGADTIVGATYADDLQGGNGDDRLMGRAGADKLLGAYGNDTLDGGTGADSMDGSDGNDVYVVDSADDIVREGMFGNGFGGTDRVETSLTIYTLGADIENLTYVGTGAFTGVGNAQANVMYGGARADALYGNEGADQLSGGGGNDALRGGTGNDTVNGGLGNDQLFGDAGNDRILGDDGNDVLRGGAGRDTLLGGAGIDHFAFAAISESAAGAGDMVRDFLSGVDKIDLASIDANTTLAGDQAFGFRGVFSGDPLFTGAGDLWARWAMAGLELRGDVDGDGIAELSIHLLGVTTLAATDLVL